MRPHLGFTTATVTMTIIITLHLHPHQAHRRSHSPPQTTAVVSRILIIPYLLFLFLSSLFSFLIFHVPISHICFPIPPSPIAPYSHIPYPHIPISHIPHHLITTPIGIPSPEQAPPRYSSELATTPRHGTHPPLGQLPPPLEHRPSSPVTLPSFNSFIRGCSSPAPHSHGPHDPILLTRHPPIQNGPLSSGPLLKSWKSENISMVIDPPSPSPALAGQQLNVPAPSLPSGYPGYAYSTPPFSSPLVLICYPGCVSFSVIPNASRASRLRSSNSLLWNSTESASHSISIFRSPTLLPSKGTKPRTSRVSPSRNLPEDTCPNHPPAENAILTLEALAIPSSYPAVQASCCRTCFSREAKRKPEAYRENLTQTLSPIDFACSEYLEFNSGTVIIPFRIICYSRHHSEKEGFKYVDRTFHSHPSLTTPLVSVLFFATSKESSPPYKHLLS